MLLGGIRNYGIDPYGDFITTKLVPKVLGVNILNYNFGPCGYEYLKVALDFNANTSN